MYRILIVDDEPMILMGLQKLIQQSAMPISSIRMAYNGQEALSMIEEELPHFVLTDIRMPMMDGLELCRHIAEMNAGIRTVVISGYDDFQYAQRSLSYGVKEYLLKPVSKKQLHETLDKLVNEHRRQQSGTYLSITKTDESLDKLEQAIYFMNRGLLDELLGGLRQEVDTYKLHAGLQRELLEQYYRLLCKKLKTRDVHIEIKLLQISESGSESGAFDQFAAQICEMFDALHKLRKGKAKDPIEEAKQYIEQNLRSEVSLEEVSDILGLHPNYFSVYFKQMTGETFIQYRIKCRMEQAKKMLSEQRHRITDISYEVGYADHSHFTKTFKKYEGISPSEYRLKLGVE